MKSLSFSLKPAALLVVALAVLTQLGLLYRQHSSAPVAQTPLDLLTPEHAYMRPTGMEVSGLLNNTAAFHRSPCPALNALANHGFLPRDGKNLTHEMLNHALMHVYHLDPLLVKITTAAISQLPHEFTLADLGKHNYIEHDASLVHNDAFLNRDPSLTNMTLVQDLFSRATVDKATGERVITKETLADFRTQRMRDSKAHNPAYGLNPVQHLQAYGEAASMLLVMGNYETALVSLAHAESFIVHERIPDDFERSKVPVTSSGTLFVIAQMKAHTLFH